MIGAVVVVGLYASALARVVVSHDWGDRTAERLFALTAIVACLWYFVTLMQPPSVSDGPWKRWTNKRIGALIVLAVFLVAGIARQVMTEWGDSTGVYLTQTAAIAGMLFEIVGWTPSRPR
ncbi:hypothetical protein DFR76_102441 [Nocardia pseudobrasiliensis]|uniref:Uncharacterized protein n=2 Tax=Nocardia pseudobrasiliensis TaxID=45979 RepID=A0A370IBP9_9NOCA|nr:hypothetical protein DFR76_102441 [Nocardia pseudobrasiliensis]